MELQIPTVTVDDLRAFHAQHFPHAPAPEHILHGLEPEAEAAEDYYDEADDGLGYYPDGTKRTLTDEQVAMFRHSEIHALLRTRRLQKENGEICDDNAVSTSPAPPCPPTQESSSHMADDVVKTQPDKSAQPKQQQWATTSATTKAKNKRKRNRYAKRRKEIRLERGLPRRRSGRDGADSGDSDDGSDEWDAWHQANGPDVQKDDTLDLDY